MAEDDENTEPRLDWSDAEGMAVQPVNVIVVQSGPESYVLNLGFAIPPLHDEEFKSAPVQVVARILLTPETMGTLINGMADAVRRREQRQPKQGDDDD